jgi:hypothetical protein
MPMHPKELRLSFDETAMDGISIKAQLEPDSESYAIFFRCNDIPLTNNPEALIAVGLLPAMKTGSALIVEGEISQKLFNAIDPITDFFNTLSTKLKKIKIKNIVPQTSKSSTENRVGLFFSGGVDSFYTFLKHQDEITDLIFIRGFDIPLTDHVLLKKTSEVIREIGLNFGKRVIEVETNLRLFYEQSFIQPYLRWQFGHGPALASTGHLLFPFFHRIYIAASHTYADSYPPDLGSHPLVDPLWSTETLNFIHDGCEATRVEKTAFIAKSDIALKSLRVCYKNPNSVYNCGVCEKCIRTMINLECAGVLERCTTFNTTIDTKLIDKIVIRDVTDLFYIKENLKGLKNKPEDQSIYNALDKVRKRAWWTKIPVAYPTLYPLFQIRWVYRMARGLGKIFAKLVFK